MVTQSNMMDRLVKKNKKKEEVQDIDTDEEDSASEESRPNSPARGG
jgi:hypothetical protein